MAAMLGPGHTIVTVLCDYGTRYQGKIYNVDFLRSRGLAYPAWLEDCAPAQRRGVEVPDVTTPVIAP
eukprot:8772202-Pyramimonas_sp.AAC.1